ncbi:Amino acid transporter [Amycolatopsis saalfeldensis]|uniref:Amino acid transporter n=2 Tax=Amycolatopsis saalfeldensis TaxID=394193 RepID=A0A1H8XXW0_9PSEU|nr:Amino acid transporter [Amycolatopsis saalfeldensis]
MVGEDGKLRRRLGFWSLLAIGVGSVIGSGWLFSAMYAANAAGPASLVSWVVGGVLMLLIALVFAELGMAHPESGALVRYPLYSNGRLAATVVGFATWLAFVGNPPTEASGVVQYASTWLGGVYDAKAGKLTGSGIVLAIVLMGLFVLLNYFGVRLFAKSNNVVTAIKVGIPVTTAVLLVVSGFDHQHGAGGVANLHAHGGFAPAGYATALAAIASAGLIFAYTGFRNIVELAGEVTHPRRDIPRALVATIVLTIVLYLALQLAFLLAVPDNLLAARGWQGINFDSPFADLAQLLGMTWLFWLLLADSSLSPSGSGIVYTASNARNVYGMAKNGLLPAAVMRIHDRSGVPRRALLLNFVIGVAFLLPLPSWHQIVSTLSTLVVFTFSIGSVTLMAFRSQGVTAETDRLRGMRIIAPAAFVVSSLVIFWATWTDLRGTIPVMVVAIGWYCAAAARRRRSRGGPVFARDDLRGGGWLVVYVVVMYLMSYAGSYGGRGWIPAPWDSVVTACLSAFCYAWAVRAGIRYLAAHPFRAHAPGHDEQ